MTHFSSPWRGRHTEAFLQISHAVKLDPGNLELLGERCDNLQFHFALQALEYFSLSAPALSLPLPVSPLAATAAALLVLFLPRLALLLQAGPQKQFIVNTHSSIPMLLFSDLVLRYVNKFNLTSSVVQLPAGGLTLCSTVPPQLSRTENVSVVLDIRSPPRPVNIAPPKCDGRVRIYIVVHRGDRECIPARLWTERGIFSPSQCS